MTHYYFDKERFLAEIRAKVAAHPGIVPAVLSAVSAGMAAWESDVKSRLDASADAAIGHALCLPSRGNYDPRRHGSRARNVAVGWGLHRRRPCCVLEEDILHCVREADALDPDGAAAHYRALGAVPVLPAEGS